MALPHITSRARLGSRIARFTGGTFELLARLELARLREAGAESSALIRDYRTVWARRMLGVFGVEPSVAGPFVEEGKLYPGTDSRGVGRLFLFNHRSGMDILLSLAFFDGTLVSRADLASWPVIGLAARRVGTLFVNREDAHSGAAVIQEMAKALERGQGICIYPEGTVFPGDPVRPLKSGAFRAAQRVGAELIPVGFAYGEEEAGYGDESFMAHMQRVASLERITVAVQVGEPLSSEGRLDASREQARSELDRCVTLARTRLSSGG